MRRRDFCVLLLGSAIWLAASVISRADPRGQRGGINLDECQRGDRPRAEILGDDAESERLVRFRRYGLG